MSGRSSDPEKSRTHESTGNLGLQSGNCKTGHADSVLHAQSSEPLSLHAQTSAGDAAGAGVYWVSAAAAAGTAPSKPLPFSYTLKNRRQHGIRPALADADGTQHMRKVLSRKRHRTALCAAISHAYLPRAVPSTPAGPYTVQVLVFFPSITYSYDTSIYFIYIPIYVGTRVHTRPVYILVEYANGSQHIYILV